MPDRRSFLIGAGALLTAPFVIKAKAFSRDTGKPLVLPAARASEQTLYILQRARLERVGVRQVACNARRG